jgi:hypothetical protein
MDLAQLRTHPESEDTSVTRIVNGMEIEQNLISISGTAEIDDDQADLLQQGRSITIVVKGHLKGRGQDVGGQNTSPRETFRLQLDSLDSIEDGGELTGQLQIGDTPADPDDEA